MNNLFEDYYMTKIKIINKLCLAVLFCFLLAWVYSAPSPAMSAQPSNDPVALAKSEIERLHVLWTPVFYASTQGVYRIGGRIAMAGGAYILLESPVLAADLLSGGIIKLGGSIAKDWAVSLIENAVRTPKAVCRGISKAVIEEGWEQYRRAYEIVKEYRKTGRLSRQAALEFLRCRRGAEKMALGRVLYERIMSADYKIDSSLAQSMTEDILGKLEAMLQMRPGRQNILMMSDAAFFMRDIVETLEARKAGLMAYKPYLQFLEDMTKINTALLEESRRFSGYGTARAETASEKAADPSVAALAQVAEPPRPSPSPERPVEDPKKFLITAGPSGASVGYFRVGMRRNELAQIAALYDAALSLEIEWGEGGTSWPEIHLLSRSGNRILVFNFSLTNLEIESGVIDMDSLVKVIGVYDSRFRSVEGLCPGMGIKEAVPILDPATYEIRESGSAYLVSEKYETMSFELEKDLWQVWDDEEFNRMQNWYEGRYPIQMLPAEMKIKGIIVWHR